MSKPVQCALVSLGCPKNLVDSEVMLGFLHEAGFDLTTDESQAEVLIVNTCAFLAASVDESLDTLRQVAKLKQHGRCKAVIAAGCLPQRDLPLLRQAVPEVDGYLGPGDLPKIVDIVRDAMEGRTSVAVTKSGYIYEETTPRLQATEPWVSYLKIAEGCDHKCTFCIIPQLRGEFRSRKVESIVAEARQMGDRGVKEVVLISQDSTRYGLDLYGKRNISELMEALSEIQTVRWFRLLYCYPTFITDHLIEVIASNGNLCRYLDVPLQHVHPDILKSMKRAGTPEDYAKLVGRIRERIPGVAIRTSFIVGFPGETEQHFQYLLDFVRLMEFDRMATFRYSRERESESASLSDQIPLEVAEDRFHRLMVAQQEISFRKNQAKVGQRLQVLVEKVSFPDSNHGNGNGHGQRHARGKVREAGTGVARSEFDAPDIDSTVRVRQCRARPGDLVEVEITRAQAYDLEAKQV